MDLLEKFGTVAVEVVNRIRPADKDFCEKHQAAYEAAKQAFQELAFFWEDMISAQKELLGGCAEDTNHYMVYLSSKGNNSIKLSAEDIESHIESLHSTFISTIVHYFNSAYNVTVSCETVKANLLPREPDFYNKEAWQAYHEQMQALTVRYQDVVEQIILRLDGHNFAEQAFHELAKKCHRQTLFDYLHPAARCGSIARSNQEQSGWPSLRSYSPPRTVSYDSWRHHRRQSCAAGCSRTVHHARRNRIAGLSSQ